MSETAAVIDLGSNSVRLTIASADGVLLRQREYVRLSENMGKDNILKEEPIERTISALKVIKNTIDEHKVGAVYAFATEAVRRAVNKDDFLKRVQRETGFSFEILSGEREAYYNFLAIRATYKDLDDCVILDTGGGSTEFVLMKQGELKGWGHIPFGAVTLTEQFDTLEQAECAINEQIKNIPWLADVKNVDIIGLGGSIRAIGLNSKAYLTRGEVFSFYFRVKEMTIEQRAQLKGVAEDRADVFAGGLVPLVVFMNQTNAKGLRFFDASLRDGVLYEHFFKKVKKIFKNG